MKHLTLARLAALIAAFSVLQGVHAEGRTVKYADARPLLDGIETLVSRSPLAKPENLRQRNREAQTLRDRSEHVFGKDVNDERWGECVKAANLAVSASLAHTSILLSSSTPDPVTVGGLMGMTFALGQAFRSCRREVELLDMPPAKSRL